MIGTVPCGTRNLVPKSLGLPVGIVEGRQNFIKGLPAKIDVIEVLATNRDDCSPMPSRLFLNAAEIGVGVEVIERLKRAGKRVNSGFVSTVEAILSTVPSYGSNMCDLFIDVCKKSVGLTMGEIGNGNSLGGSWLHWRPVCLAACLISWS